MAYLAQKKCCQGISGFVSHRMVDWCFTKERRRLSRYLKAQLLQNIANHKRLGAVRASSEMAVIGLVVDSCVSKRARF